MTISVAIVAMDEEANIGRTLASVRWADEIVLVDSGSKDRTCEIAREHGARVVLEPWRGYVAQKQYAIELCTKDWVLLLDADEEVSPGLAEEIRAAIASPNAPAATNSRARICFSADGFVTAVSIPIPSCGCSGVGRDLLPAMIRTTAAN